MADEPRANMRYQPQYCMLRQQMVWAIWAQQPSGEWKIVNCLDKDEQCFTTECAFTSDCGQWPYQPSTVERSSSSSG